MGNLGPEKSIGRNDKVINKDLKQKMTEYKSSIVESLSSKIDRILSYELALNKINKESQSLIKLQFYEDKNPEIEELERTKEEIDREFKNISKAYQTDQKFVTLLQNDDTTNAVYMKYIEVYENFSIKFRESIENLISESFSPYVYQDSEFLYSMSSQNNKTELIEYSIEKSQQTEIDVDLHVKLTNDEVMVVQLPNNELFCTGNQSGNRYSCIIDINSYKLKRVLPSTLYLHRAGIFYHQQNIYILGGIDFPEINFNPLAGSPFTFKDDESNREKFNDKFDLIKNKWTSIPPAPDISFSSVSAVPFKQRIIIAALEFENIYEYDINLESYTEIKFHLGTTEKLIIAGNSRVYLIESWICLWESEYDNEYSWERIGNFERGLFNAQSYKVIDKKSVYFGVFDIYLYHNSKFLYYEFNLEDKKFKEIQSFKGPEVELQFHYSFD